jgi:hypothetical protein
MTNRRSQLMDETAQYLLFIKSWSNFKDIKTKEYEDLYDYSINIDSEEENIKRKASKKGKNKAKEVINISSEEEEEEDISQEESEEEEVNYSDLD